MGFCGPTRPAAWVSCGGLVSFFFAPRFFSPPPRLGRFGATGRRCHHPSPRGLPPLRLTTSASSLRGGPLRKRHRHACDNGGGVPADVRTSFWRPGPPFHARPGVDFGTRGADRAECRRHQPRGSTLAGAWWRQQRRRGGDDAPLGRRPRGRALLARGRVVSCGDRTRRSSSPFARAAAWRQKS